METGLRGCGVKALSDALGGAVNRLLAPTGFMITRAAPGQAESWRARIGGPYRTDREVIALAAQRGRSVGDYLEDEWGQSGRSRQIVARLQAAGAVPADLQSVCEIGPGSGRFIERILELASPARYEIYEIEPRRARWLARTYPVVARTSDGEHLSDTADHSIQLVHAHGVFASLKTITSFAYFREFARITAPGGHVAFDIISEECLRDDDVDAWLKTPLRYVRFLPKPFLIEFFERHGFSLVVDFPFPLMVFGQSVYLVFTRIRA
jgi:hypothetical protein